MKAAFGLRIIVDEIQPDDRGEVRDGLLLLQDRLGLADDVRGAPDRGAARQLDDDEERALVVLRQEAGRGDLQQGRPSPTPATPTMTRPMTEKRTMRATAAP